MSASLEPGDRLQIHELLAGYAWSLDTGDVEGFVSCFAADGELLWDAFAQPGLWRGHEALRRFVSCLVARPESAGRQHHVSNIVVEPHAEGATVRSYVFVAVRSTVGPHLVTVMGHYDDVVVRIGDQWRIRRRVIRDWSGPLLSRFAGQSGERVARELPAALTALWATQ